MSAAEFKRRIVLMERWFEEFGDAQRTAALARIEPLLGASQFHLLARRFSSTFR